MTTTHGGRREGAGRPFGEEPQKHIRIAASEAEYTEIIKWLTPRQRTLALLDAATVCRMEREMDRKVSAKEWAASLISSQYAATLEDYGGDVEAYVTALMELATELSAESFAAVDRDDLRKWLTYYVED